MSEEVKHSGIALGDPIAVRRNGNIYMIPTPNNASYVQTEKGRYLKKETVDKLVSDYFKTAK